MSYQERMILYKQIEEYTKRPLITYVTSTRTNASARIAADIIPEFIKQINFIPEGFSEVDLLVVSNGGDPTVSWRIISMLRERFRKVRVLLPYVAYSGATLLALGADEIIMHPFSNLGPVDPQLTYTKPGNSGTSEFGAEDLRNYMDFVRKEVGISDQAQMEKAFELVCREVGAIPIGIAKRSSQLMLSMGEKLLSLHMEDRSKAKTITETLSRSFYHHGYALGRNEAKKIELPVVIPEKELEDLIWKVWENIESEMDCKKPFNPLEVALDDQETLNRLTGPILNVCMPPNLPPQVTQQINQEISQKMLKSIDYINPIDYKLFLASLESIRCHSQYWFKGKIYAFRQTNMEIMVNSIQISKGWEFELNNYPSLTFTKY